MTMHDSHTQKKRLLPSLPLQKNTEIQLLLSVTQLHSYNWDQNLAHWICPWSVVHVSEFDGEDHTIGMFKQEFPIFCSYFYPMQKGQGSLCRYNPLWSLPASEVLDWACRGLALWTITAMARVVRCHFWTCLESGSGTGRIGHSCWDE